MKGERFAAQQKVRDFADRCGGNPRNREILESKFVEAFGDRLSVDEAKELAHHVKDLAGWEDAFMLFLNRFPEQLTAGELKQLLPGFAIHTQYHINRLNELLFPNT